MLFADEFADLVINDLAKTPDVRISNKDAARLRLLTSLGRELEAFDTVMRDSISPTRDCITYATVLSIRKVLSTDHFINSFVELCDSLDPDADLGNTIRKRMELKLATEQQLHQWVNQVVDEFSDWCGETQNSIATFFEEAAKSDRDYTSEDAAHWQGVYEREQQRLRAEEQEKQDQRLAIKAAENATEAPSPSTTDENRNNAAAFGCLVAIPFALIGFVIHPGVGIVVGLFVFFIVASVAEKIGIALTIIGLVILAIFLFNLISGSK